MKRYLCLAPFLFAGCLPTEPTCIELLSCEKPFLDGGAEAQSDEDADAASDDVSITEDASDGADDRRADAGDGANDRIDGRSDGDGAKPDANDGARVDADDAPDPDAGDGFDGRTCVPTAKPSEDTCVVDEKYGVFVAPTGNDVNGLGTRAAPYKTIAKGLTVATNVKRVYVCNSGTPYAEQVTLTNGAQLFGGFACSDWTYAATQKVVVKPSTVIPALNVQTVSGGALVEDVQFETSDATLAGTSSIAAVVVASNNVVLRRVSLVAGKGADGAGGVDGATGDPGALADLTQQGKAAVCSDAGTSQPGGAWPVGGCGSRGGNGGAANLASPGSPGVAGSPQGTSNGGPIEMNGLPGDVGTLGAHGIAAATGGTFSTMGFTAAVPGGTGIIGNVGQGGGGGGASSSTTATCIGASGGAGGMGGCGGKPGTGGAGGGASIALLSWMSTVTLDACSVTSAVGGRGGNGGSGGSGGLGQNGATGGAPTGSILKGGEGGHGGDGGPGGSGAGGTGGPSYAIATKGTAPLKPPGTTLTAMAGGTAGIGGTSSTTISKAPDGTAGDSATEFTIP